MRKLGLFFAAVVVVLSMSFMPVERVSANGVYYSDIPKHHRAYDEITYLLQGGFTSSDQAHLFAPDQAMTRAHAAMMIGKAMHFEGKQQTTKFSDVPSSHAASGYINEAVAQGIIKGYQDGTFKPNQTLTRGEMAVLISRALGMPANSTTAAANSFIANGISDGIGDGTFGVGQKMKRGDFAVFLARAINPEFRQKMAPMMADRAYVSNIKKSDRLNVRKGPNVTYAGEKALHLGYPVSVYYEVGKWSYIGFQGDYGYVNTAFLAKSQPSVSGTIPNPVNVNIPAKPITPPAAVVPEKPAVTPPSTSSPKPTGALSRELIMIDPGHGGHDSGAVGHGYAEKTATLAISRYAKQYFDASPFQVKMTRTGDYFVGLSERARMANNLNASMFISVHINSASNPNATGLEAYHFKTSNAASTPKARVLTAYMQNRMLEAWPLRNRGVKAANFAVLRETRMPATLLEAGFINNKNDNYYIRTPQQQQKMGRAIYLGALDYYYHYEGRKSEVAPLYSKVGASPSKRLH